MAFIGHWWHGYGLWPWQRRGMCVTFGDILSQITCNNKKWFVANKWFFVIRSRKRSLFQKLEGVLWMGLGFKVPYRFHLCWGEKLHFGVPEHILWSKFPPFIITPVLLSTSPCTSSHHPFLPQFGSSFKICKKFRWGL